MTTHESRLGAIVAAKVAPPPLTYAVLAGLMYFPAMTILVILIGHRAGYYVLA